MIDEVSAEEKRWRIVSSYIQAHRKIRNADVCRLLAVSSAKANRLLRTWVQESRLERFRDGKTWAYRLVTVCNQIQFDS